MEEIRLKARAKINLTLDVTGKRDNGYHELQMIMQTVGLYDEIVLRKIPENEIRLESNVSWLPADNRNLAWRAAELMRSTYDIKDGVLTNGFLWRQDWLAAAQTARQCWWA